MSEPRFVGGVQHEVSTSINFIDLKRQSPSISWKITFSNEKQKYLLFMSGFRQHTTLSFLNNRLEVKCVTIWWGKKKATYYLQSYLSELKACSKQSWKCVVSEGEKAYMFLLKSVPSLLTLCVTYRCISRTRLLKKQSIIRTPIIIFKK